MRHYDHGNSLSLTSITRERDAEVPARSRVEPAPAQFAVTVGRTLAAVAEPGVRLMRAAAVLGPRWGGLAAAAEVAGIDDPDPAAQALADVKLLQIRNVDGVIEIRPAHDLIRSAVYAQIPLADRRVLHLAASRRAGLPVETVLEHRLSASPRYDAALADELAEFGWSSYRRRQYRRAAQLLRWASSVTEAAPLRERRWLDALYASVMARDYALVRGELGAVREAADTLRAHLVAGAVEVMEGNWLIAVNILGAAVEPGHATAAPIDPEDALVVYRIEVLLAWALSGSGGSTAQVLAGLQRAADLSVRDAALDPYVGYTQGPAQVRLTGPVAALDALHLLAADPADVPPEQRYALGWRGLLLNTIGSFEDAITNQRAMQRSVQAGQSDDASSGGIHAFAAFSHWMLGQWDLATVNFRLAMDTPHEFVLPVVLAYLPVDPAGRGDLAEADRRLARAEHVIDDLRWPEAIQNLLMAQVVRYHAASTPTQRAELLPSMQQRWGTAITPTGLVGPTWLMHAAIAAIWAADFPFATQLITRMRTFNRRPAWVQPISGWLTALVAEGAGDPATAIRILRSTPDQAARSVPLYRAHLAADLARLEYLVGDSDRAQHAITTATDRYSRIGALNYVEQLHATFPTQDSSSTPRASPVENSITSISRTYDINDRERDVLTLVADGLSYLQISHDLFITRSTVAYHMSKIYAKTGTANRHELIGLLRNR